MTFISESCQGEVCSICGMSAARKVGEEFFHDEPNPYRHNLTAYLCMDHFTRLMDRSAHLNIQSVSSDWDPNQIFLQIKEADNAGKPYYYAERLGKDSIAFILKKDEQYGLIHEWKPPLQEWLVTAYGGSIDSNKSLRDILLQEIKEEAGYAPWLGAIQYMGKHFVSTQMNQFCYLFLVPVENIQGISKPETEDAGERKSNPVWMPRKLVLETQCWKAKTILQMEFEGMGVKYV